MRNYLIVFILCFNSFLSFSQELNCNVVVNARQTGSENQQVFKTLEKQLAIKDTIISSYKLKESNFRNEMDVITEVMKLKDGQIAVAKDETKHYKKQRNLFGVGGGGIIALIILILL